MLSLPLVGIPDWLADAMHPSDSEHYVSYWVDPAVLAADRNFPYIPPSLDELNNLKGAVYRLATGPSPLSCPSQKNKVKPHQHKPTASYGSDSDLWMVSPKQPECSTYVGTFFIHKPSRRAFLSNADPPPYSELKAFMAARSRAPVVVDKRHDDENRWSEMRHIVSARFFTDSIGRVGLDTHRRPVIWLCTEGTVTADGLLCLRDASLGAQGKERGEGDISGMKGDGKGKGNEAEKDNENTEYRSMEIYNWFRIDYLPKFQDGNGVAQSWRRIYHELLDLAVRQYKELEIKREYPDWAD